MGSRIARTVHQVQSYTLCQLERGLARWVPLSLFPKASRQQNSRDRLFTRWRTFWSALWQALNPEASGREVVRQLQGLLDLHDGPKIAEDDSAYCQARARLPLAEFPKALAATARAADQEAPPMTLLRGRSIKVIDGSALTLPDTAANRKAYPPLPPATPPSFPMMRIVVFFSLLSGAILALAQGGLTVSELACLRQLSSSLAAGDILVGDQGFGHYVVPAWLQHLGVDFIGRPSRHTDGRRRLRRLGRRDWLFVWLKPGKPSPWLSALEWAGLPPQLTVRVIKGGCARKGFRVRQVTLVTSLLDPALYPAHQILEAYLRRWRLEMCLDDLKTTLKMDLLRSKSPELAQKEVFTRLIAHNLIRCIMAEAATQHEVPLDRISFKGTLDALRHYAQAIAQARSRKKARLLWENFLAVLAADLVPERPDRVEPRAVKRKKSKYPRLNKPRRQFRDHPKRNTRRTTARLRRLGLI